MKCARCGKEFKILFPINGFEVCTECCDKVRLEIKDEIQISSEK